MSQARRGSCVRGDRECPGEIGNVPGRSGMSWGDWGCPGPSAAWLKSGCQLPRQDNGSIGREQGDKGAAFRNDFICIHVTFVWNGSLESVPVLKLCFQMQNYRALINLSFYFSFLILCHRCLRRGHVQITRWWWASFSSFNRAIQ